MKSEITLRTRLVILVLAAIVPLFGLSIVGAVLTADDAVSRATKNLELSASLVAANQQRLVDSVRQVLTAVASMPEIAQGKSPECLRYFKTLTERLPVYSNLGTIGVDGYVRCHSVPNNSPLFAGDRPYFQGAMARREFVVGGYLLGRISAKAIMSFALPVVGDQGQVTAVAFASMPLSEFAKEVADAPLPKGSRLVILDRQGIVLVANPPQSAVVGQPVASPVLQAAIKTGSEGVFEGPDAAGAQQIYAFLPSSKSADAPFFVAVSADRGEVLAPARQRLGLVFLALTLVAFLGSWIAWMMGGRAIVKPTTDILAAARQVQAGRLDVRIAARSASGESEFAKIASSFNLMTDALEQRQHALDQELDRSRQAYSTLELTINSMHEGLMAVDAAGRFLLVNEPAKKLFAMDGEASVLTPHWSREQGLFVPGTETLFPFDETPLYRALKGESGGPVSVFLRNGRQPQGRLLSCSYRPMHHGSEIVGALVVFSDITEVDRLQLEQAASYARLSQTQRRLLDAQHLGRIGIWELDIRSGKLWISDELYELYDLDRDAPGDIGQRLRALIHPDDIGHYMQQRRDAARAQLPTNSEYRIVTAAGETRWMHQFDRLQTDSAGRGLHRTGVVQEITERKRAEQALIDSEQRYAALFEMAPVPMWVYDMASCRFLTVNRAAVQGYGYSAQEFLSMVIFDIRPGADHASLRAHLASTSTARKESAQHRRKDGSLFPVNVVSQPIQYAGRAARFVVALDITAQVNAEKDVQEYLFTLQRAADAAQAITWHQTLDGMLQEVVEQARGVIGAHQAVVSLTLGGDWKQAVHAVSMSEKYAAHHDLPVQTDGTGIYALVCENNRALRMTQAELEAHPRWRGFGSHADKHPPLRGWLAVPLMGRSGKNIGLLQLSDRYEGEFTLQDEYVALELAQLASIAIENAQLLDQVHQLNAGLEQKISERTAALVRQEALFRTLAEQAPQVVWTVNPGGSPTYFNRAWFELVGGELQDWVGTQWFRAMHPEDLPDVQAAWDAAMANRAPFMGIRRVLARDGSYHTMSYRASPVFDDQGEVAFWVGIDADITELKAIEAALRLSNQELEAFSYSVSHDLRAPLNTIDGFSRLLSKQLTGGMSEKGQHYLARIQAGVTQMGKLIEDLLSLAQVSRMQLRYEPVDLSALGRDILGELQAHQPERHVVFSIEDGLLAHGDARLVRVVMENLLSNAWKFTSKKPHASITIGKTPDAAGQPVFFVNDNGAGFDMEYADKLFLAFQRLHTASEFPGTGVGLATVSRVIGRHGGLLWAESSPGQGATFFFTLPPLPTSV